MPTYEFTCVECNQEADLLIRTRILREHSEYLSCGSRKLEKELSVFATADREGADSVRELAPYSGIPGNHGRCHFVN